MHWIRANESYWGPPHDTDLIRWEYRNTEDVLVGSINCYVRSYCHDFEIYDHSGAVVTYGENNGDNSYNTCEATKSTVEILAREFGVAEE